MIHIFFRDWATSLIESFATAADTAAARGPGRTPPCVLLCWSSDKWHESVLSAWRPNQSQLLSSFPRLGNRSHVTEADGGSVGKHEHCRRPRVSSKAQPGWTRRPLECDGCERWSKHCDSLSPNYQSIGSSSYGILYDIILLYDKYSYFHSVIIGIIVSKTKEGFFSISRGRKWKVKYMFMYKCLCEKIKTTNMFLINLETFCTFLEQSASCSFLKALIQDHETAALS